MIRRRFAPFCIIAVPLLAVPLLGGCAGDAERAREVGRERFAAVEDDYQAQFRSLVVAAGGAVPDDRADGVSAVGAPDDADTALAVDAAARAGDGAVRVATEPPAAARPLREPGEPRTKPSEGPSGTPAEAGSGRERERTLVQKPPLPTPRIVPRRTPRLRPTRKPIRQPTPTPEPAPTRTPRPTPEPTPAPTPEPIGSDADPPTLLMVEFDPPQVNDGGEVVIRMQASDNLAGVRSASGSMSSPSRKKFIPFHLVANGDTDWLTGRFRVPPQSESGTWGIASLRLTDRASNAIVLTPSEHPIVAGALLSVASQREDTKPPQLLSLSLSPSNVEDGGTVRVSVQASDEEGSVSTVRGILANPSGSVQLNFYPRLNPETGMFEGTVSLPKHSEYGEWHVSLLTLTDSANNRTTVTGENAILQRARLNVNSSSSDTLPPELVSVLITPSHVEQGAVAEVVLRVSDDLSGVKSVTGWAMNDRARIPLRVRQLPSSDDFQGSFTIPADAKIGTWKIERLSMTDKAGNRKLLTASAPELESATFEVVLRPR